VDAIVNLQFVFLMEALITFRAFKSSQALVVGAKMRIQGAFLSVASITDLADVSLLRAMFVDHVTV